MFFCRENIYHKWWYFLKCDTQSYLSCYIQKLVKKDMFPITQKGHESCVKFWTNKPSPFESLFIFLENIFVLYFSTFEPQKVISCAVKMRGIYDTTSSDKHLAVPSMKRLGSLRKRPFFHSKYFFTLFSRIFTLNLHIE